MITNYGLAPQEHFGNSVLEPLQVGDDFEAALETIVSASDKEFIGSVAVPQTRKSKEDYESEDMIIPDNFFQENHIPVACDARPEEGATVCAHKGVDLEHQGNQLSVSNEIHNKDVPARDERGRILNPDREADECVDLLLKLGCSVPNPSLTKANIIARIKKMQRPK